MKQDELTRGQNSKGPMKQGPVKKGQNGSGLGGIRPNWLRTNWEDPFRAGHYRDEKLIKSWIAYKSPSGFHNLFNEF